MAPADLLAEVRRRPFVPFRVVTSDSTTYEVRHPELILVAMGSAVIGYPVSGTVAPSARYDIVSMRHIIRLEPMEPEEAEIPPPTEGGNGQSNP